MSLCLDAINSIEIRYRWIARAAYDVSLGTEDLAHALRNVRCDAIRATIARIPTDGTAVKAPAKRADAIECLAMCVRQLRAYGFVQVNS